MSSPTTACTAMNWMRQLALMHELAYCCVVVQIAHINKHEQSHGPLPCLCPWGADDGSTLRLQRGGAAAAQLACYVATGLPCRISMQDVEELFSRLLSNRASVCQLPVCCLCLPCGLADFDPFFATLCSHACACIAHHCMPHCNA